MMRRLALVSLLSLAVAACSSKSGGGGPGTPDSGGGPGTPDSGGNPTADAGDPATSFNPLVVGETWTLQATNTTTGVTTNKTETVEAYEDIGGNKAGVMGFRIKTSKSGGKEQIAWMQVSGNSVLREREQFFDALGAMSEEDYFDPDKVRINGDDATQAPGYAYDQTYTLSVQKFPAAPTTASNTDHWEVVATAESVTVPAGTFSCLHMHRTNAAAASDKNYWFAAGVGKIKEVGATSTEVLTAHTLP